MKIKSALGPSLSRHLRLISTWSLIISMVMIVTACTLLGQEEATPIAQGPKPTVTITDPVAGQTVVVGNRIDIRSRTIDQRGIARVELIINDQVVRVDANAAPEPNMPFIVAQPWVPETPGTYTIQVQAFNTANVAGDSERLVVTVTTAEASSADNTPLTATVAATVGPATATPPQENSVIDAPSPLPTATLAPTNTPVPTNTPAPTSTPKPTNTLEPTPIPLPTGTFAPTGLEPDGRFKDIWTELAAGEGLLGYPIQPQIDDRDFAKQYFSGGMMIWWDNPNGDNYIWAITDRAEDFQSGGHWERFVDRWEDAEKYSCEAARDNGGQGPIRGFGKVWCDNAAIATSLGDPIEPEMGSGGNAPYSIVQFFQGGTMVYNPLNSEVFVLFNVGPWKRFWY